MITDDQNAHDTKPTAQSDSAADAAPHDAAAPATIRVFGREMPRSVAFRMGGLALFLLLIVGATLAMWPVISSVFSEAGRANLINEIHSAGPFGMLILFGLEFVQVIVAFIPGEVVQLVAGMLYGPWLGSAIILVGCVCATAVIYELVHRLGQPFVEEVVSIEHLERFREFERSGKLAVMVFILFFIPGLPKDVFTYLVPLTSMPRRAYRFISTIARTPGVVMTSLAASHLAQGNYAQSVVFFAVLAVLAVLGIYNKDRILNAFNRHKSED